MKNKYLMVGAVLFASSAIAQESGGTRGGGRALVCRDANASVTSVRMLDVLEGLEKTPVGYGLSIDETQDANLPQARKDVVVNRIINDAIGKLNGLENLQKEIRDRVTKLRNERVEEPNDFDLLPPEDVGKYHLKGKPKDCHFEAVGVYFEDGILHVNPELYGAMDSTNQATFFLHEGIYDYYRAKWKHKTSEVSRERTAQLISTTPKVDRSFAEEEYWLVVKSAPKYELRYYVFQIERNPRRKGSRKIIGEMELKILRKVAMEKEQFYWSEPAWNPIAAYLGEPVKGPKDGEVCFIHTGPATYVGMVNFEKRECTLTQMAHFYYLDFQTGTHRFPEYTFNQVVWDEATDLPIAINTVTGQRYYGVLVK